MSSTKALEKYLEPLDPFLKTDGVTELCINRPREIYLEKNSKFTRHEVARLDLKFLEELAVLIAEYNDKSKDDPLLAGTLPTGERVQCVRHPACDKGIICSIRRHQMRDMSLDDYERFHAFDELANAGNPAAQVKSALLKLYKKGEILAFLRLAIASKQNIIISGGTGTGKTTFLNACLKLIPDTERLITVEDTREVVVKQPNAVHLLFNEDNDKVTALKMFKTCLRLRPDRIFLSELRGAEAWAFLRAANSGHPGSFSTVHADTPQACFEQLVFMVQQAGSTSNDERIKKYIKSIINIVIQLKRCASGKRFMYVSEIYFDAAAEASSV